MAKPRRHTLDTGEMTFQQIGDVLGISASHVHQIYLKALKKLQKDGPAIDVLIEWADYHRHLRARSAECLAAREHW
jgi:DNA-directed RNA polymerase sigma subunit (sigma70/sigma32)